MPATFATERSCPYCGERIRLAACPIVATNFDGSDQMPQPERTPESYDGLLPSGRSPIGVLANSGWPILLRAPLVEAKIAAEGLGRARRMMRPSDERTELVPIVDCRLNAEDVPARACPKCQYPLPLGIDEREIHVLVILGVNRVGKSHFIAASLYEAYHRGSLDEILGCNQFDPGGGSGTRFQTDYTNVLFRQRKILPQTDLRDTVRFRPLEFSVTIPGRAPATLIVHDLAGEALGNEKLRARVAPFLKAASGVIFLADPREFPGVREDLEVTHQHVLRGLETEIDVYTGETTQVMKEKNELGFDQVATLGSFLDEMREQKHTIPIAVTVAKADLLANSATRPVPFLARANPREENLVDFMARVRSSGAQIAEYLELVGAYNLVRTARRYQQSEATAWQVEHELGPVTFHAVSALGTPPDANDQLGGEPKPLNCADPLAAVLAQMFDLC